MVIDKIRQHIEDLDPGTLIATRDMLGYGKRNAVDVSMHRLFKEQVISRITPGLYMKGNWSTPPPQVEVIARAKADAFDRAIVSISKRWAKKLGLPIESDAVAIFATTGRTSSFKLCGGGVVQFIGVACRKMRLGDSEVGIALRALWRLGKERAALKIPQVATKWQDADWSECAGRSKQLAQWLSEGLGLPRPGIGAAAQGTG